jgi:hypothetical protein
MLSKCLTKTPIGETIDFQYFPVQDKKVTAFIIAIGRED